MKRQVGLEAIILYKLIKAGAEALAGIAALIALFAGAEVLSASLAQMLLDHVTHHWALRAAQMIEVAGTTRNLIIVVIAAFADAALSAVEGLALRAGRWWAPWLVVVATGTPLPWELAEIVRHPLVGPPGQQHPHWIRILLLLLNIAVVVYLLNGVRREQREKAHAATIAAAANPPHPPPPIPPSQPPAH